MTSDVSFMYHFLIELINRHVVISNVKTIIFEVFCLISVSCPLPNEKKAIGITNIAAQYPIRNIFKGYNN